MYQPDDPQYAIITRNKKSVARYNYLRKITNFGVIERLWNFNEIYASKATAQPTVRIARKAWK